MHRSTSPLNYLFIVNNLNRKIWENWLIQSLFSLWSNPSVLLLTKDVGGFAKSEVGSAHNNFNNLHKLTWFFVYFLFSFWLERICIYLIFVVSTQYPSVILLFSVLFFCTTLNQILLKQAFNIPIQCLFNPNLYLRKN